jgi:pyruvate,water dikinase
MSSEREARMSDVLGFEEIDRTQLALVGGKGAHLAELARVEGLRVPDGFCVTSRAYAHAVAGAPSVDEGLERLSRMKAGDREAIQTLSAQIRRAIETIALPGDLATAIARALAELDEHGAYAVRSSATAEDLPTASFAGQHDSYLNVTGPTAVVEHVRRCWASLFSERAVTYRLRNGFDHRNVRMAVVVQRMVLPQAAGVLFTADPVTGNRRIASVEAVRGLAESLVSGRVDADVFKVRDGEIVSRQAAERPALTDAQAARLAQVGRRIEAHFGHPQDIEWCLAEDEFWIVQSRPITTLFPIPASGDRQNRVYVSVGHQQMMTDPMKPLGLSFWQLTAARPMFDAAGRLFVDVSQDLASPAGRARVLEGLGKSDLLVGDALQTILGRGDFIRALPDADPGDGPAAAAPAPIATDPGIVAELIAHTQAANAALQRDLRGKSGSALLDFILADLQEHKRSLFDPRSLQVIMAPIEAAWWLNDRLRAWLGEKNPADTLTRSVSHNVTSEMGLALLDVADAIRPHPDVVAFLQHVEAADFPDERFLDALAELAGGQAARDAIQAFLDRYGMRCPGEIDITRPRWSERPTALVPTLLANINAFEPGAGPRRFEQGRQEAFEKERELLARLRDLPDGTRKAEEAKKMIDRVRTFAGYREYPKYGMVSRFFIYKRALLEEAERLVHTGVLREPEDIFFLRLEELRDVVHTNRADDHLIRRRKDAFKSHQALTPPRVLTSDGEVITGAYRRHDLPHGALAGIPVSAGTIEGRARVILDMAQADLEPGDILVTTYTDPSWTPLFLAVDGLVTEVGGLMTHGAVIAREYGLPAVAGVQNATHFIRDGQQIRVHGTDGYVEILPRPDQAAGRQPGSGPSMPPSTRS